MRKATMILMLMLLGCAVQPITISDREATALMVGQWSQALGHWTFTEGGVGFFESAENASDIPFAYEFIWRVENAVLHIEYEAPIEENEDRKQRYTIRELNEGKLVLLSLTESRSMTLINDNF